MIEAWLSASRDEQVGLPRDDGQDAGVGREAGLEDERGLDALEVGQVALELLVQGHRAGDRADRSGADAEVAHGSLRPPFAGAGGA